MKAYRKQSKKRKLAQKMKSICTHCQKKGHLIAQFWTLYPTTHPKHMKQEDKNTGENVTSDSIIDVSPDDSQQEDVKQEKSPLK